MNPKYKDLILAMVKSHFSKKINLDRNLSLQNLRLSGKIRKQRKSWKMTLTILYNTLKGLPKSQRIIRSSSMKTRFSWQVILTTTSQDTSTHIQRKSKPWVETGAILALIRIKIAKRLQRIRSSPIQRQEFLTGSDKMIQQRD
jgi:sensor c-di-GMP phosphodiesterase-like protein